MLRRCLLLLSLFLVPACAWTEETVQIPRPAVVAAPVPAAAGVTITVLATDVRTEREISHKKNGYGMRAANIMAANNLARDMEASLNEVFQQQGFRPGGDFTISFTLNRFYNTFDMHFFSATATAQAIGTINVTDRNGRAIYSRVYSADNQLTGVQLMSADNAAASLTAAYGALITQISQDAQLTRVLTEMGRPNAGSMGRPTS